MSSKITFKVLKFILLIFFLTQSSYAQLSSFTFSVTPTNETCLGNGVLTFNVSGTLAGSTMVYAVYQLPNLTTPLAVVTTPSLTGLNAGNYKVIATQSLGSSSASKQQDVSIVNAIIALNFTISSTKVRCGNDGIINVNVTSGNAVSYQILSGPVTTSMQASNVFSNLPVGVYQIRVFNNCGEAVVQTYTLLQAALSLIIDPVSFQTNILPSCNTILVTNFFGVLTGFEIAFPLTFEHTVFPPGSATPIVYNQIVTSGATVNQIIPFYHNQSYYYDLKVTDACGNVYNRNNNIVNKRFDFTASVLKLNCTEIALKLSPEFYVAPYTINFLSFPSGFNPLVFNSLNPGPFSGVDIYYGGVGNSFPVGSYNIQIIDSCGRTMTKTITVTNINPVPVAVGSSNGCGDLTILINSIQMVSVIIVSAPSAYNVALPSNVSNLISPDGTQFFITGLPLGTYTFHVVDSCGVLHIVSATVSPYIPGPISVIQRPGCSVGFGSVIVNAPGGIATAVLINAPTSYSGTLPINLSANILSSTFYFGSVALGNYTFQFTSSCGAQRTDTISVTGYQTTNNLITVTENCGSFNLFLQNVSNGNFLENYWLQKFNPITSQWVHPLTGVVYVDGAVLNGTNSIFLLNNTNNLNLAFVGQFRVLKGFKSLVNTQYINCYEVINSFNFSGGPQITNVYAFLCSGATNEVIVEATGLPPLNYSITSKNGLPFYINNGTLNSFTNLEPAIYNFQVQDICGNIVNSIFDVTTLDPFEIESSIFCSGQDGMLSVPLFSFLTYEWWKGTDTSTILSTSNELNFTPYNSTTDVGTYYVRITNLDNSASCVDTILEYTISPDNDIPNAGTDGAISLCGAQTQIDLFAILGGTFNTTGVWQEVTLSGASLSGSLWNATTVAYGTYQFKYSVNGSCGNFDESFVEITLNGISQTPIASVDSVICNTQDLQLYANSIVGVTYQWSGPNGFSSSEQNPIILNAAPINNGIYTLETLSNGCASLPSSVEVVVAEIPEFTIAFACINNAATLTATSVLNSFDAQTATYEWSNSEGFSSFNNPISITGEPRGTYALTVTNSFGCSATYEVDVLNTLCSIPKGISPNGDNTNDEFDLSGFSGVEKVTIFNRYGMIIFEQENYINQWIGQDKNGNLLPDGTYYYVVSFDTNESKTGWVYLMRE